MKKIVLIVCVVLLMLSLSACSFFVSGPREIKTTGFDDAKALLAEQYELSLPDFAVFIGGYFDNAFRDPSIIVAFVVEGAAFEEMFSDNWQEETYIDQPWIMEEYLLLNDFTADRKYSYNGELYTDLWGSERADGQVLCVFSGRHPGRSSF